MFASANTPPSGDNMQICIMGTGKLMRFWFAYHGDGEIDTFLNRGGTVLVIHV